MSNIQLIQGDCLELMKDIPDKSVDMILCDLPYGTTACAWDIVIPFESLWEHYHRVIKDNGVIALFGSQPFSSLLVASNIKDFREELVWLKNKPASGFKATQRHMKIHEQIEVFAPSAKYTYNPQKWLVEDKEFITQRKTFKDNEYIGNRIYGATTRTRKPDTGERNPISIVSCRVPFTPQNSKTYSDDVELRYHPTQKPVALLEYLIKTYTDEGDLVLDNCMGSGSTGVAAKNTNRDFIGMELDESYFEIAKKRIEETFNSPKEERLMLVRSEKPITKEQYERAQLNNGYVTEADLQEIFSMADLCGYGVYSPVACARYSEATGETTYIVSYTTSTNCD